ncbi:MAG: bifunctional aspartate kinase/diaminopimelate decarboxylase [Gammaproteobacteria bacterium]|nr:bifunctional aspartate kinase/diaminopimelate decarboxylase [Gammaproteobacteria bacterium]
MRESQAVSWVVLKFGGTSVSSRANWNRIAAILRVRLDERLRVAVVHSAVSGVTDALLRLLDRAAGGAAQEEVARIADRHHELAAALGIGLPEAVAQQLDELARTAGGIALLGEVSDAVRARVLAAGELMATALGAAYLNAQGITTTLVDARSWLTAQPARGQKLSLLSASCSHEADPALVQRFNALPGVILTQGFIASGEGGQTVVLGRGGSDTSGAYLAARLTAARLEIWTDVPGMFSANPRAVPSARLLKSLHYDEAQEIATSGAKVLHPRCIMPVRQHGIPLYVYATQAPELPGTIISAGPADGGARLKAIALRKGITLIAMDSPGMWHEVGFLADAFAVFRQHGMSVDLVSTSETNVTVSLDPQANALDGDEVDALVEDLGRLCRVRVIGPCASLSLLGRDIRAIIHRLGEAFELFEEQHIYLISQAANDLNFTFVIDEDQGDRLVTLLHELLIRPTAHDPVLGPTWEQITQPRPDGAARDDWWRRRRAELLGLLDRRAAAYVVDLATVRAQAQALLALTSVSRICYAVKANAHPDILRCLAAAGLSFECVSPGEVTRVREAVPALARSRLLFTPNFAPRSEYELALRDEVPLTVDNLHALREWPELFRGRALFVRIDTGRGHGHHQKVRTAGTLSKFGVPLAELDELESAAAAAGARVVGLHAHTGSGHFEIGAWVEAAGVLAGVAQRFAEVGVLNLGGGLGVPERPDRPPLDLSALDAALGRFRAAHPRFELWLEPGRFLVASAGVLLARVTQLKGKGELHYVGVATGMNSLIRPALYGAWHEIVNLSRLDEPAGRLCTVVGPICESGDVLGHDRLLPQCREGDVLLVATAGAYGAAMASHYNLREPAPEVML